MIEVQESRPYMPVEPSTEDWNTPPELVDLIRRIFDGEIDCDPCSNPYSVVGAAREVWLPEWVRAAQATGRVVPPSVVEGDGLEVMWEERTFFNPPYSFVPLTAFMQRAKWMSKELGYSSIGLVPSKTSLKGWQAHVPAASRICFIDGRVKFLVPGGGQESAPFSSALVLWSESRELAHRFSWYLDGKLGHVVRPA